MQLRKWNYITRTYEPFEVPDDRQISLYSEDMDARVQCAHCGRIIKYGEGYTSRTIHTAVGFGYIICEHCYEQEADDIIRYKREEMW